MANTFSLSDIFGPSRDDEPETFSLEEIFGQSDAEPVAVPESGLGSATPEPGIGAERRLSRTGVDNLQAQVEPVVPVFDPFAGESFSDLARRRGQQFVRGAGEVAASIPEAVSIGQAGLEMRNRDAAEGQLDERAETIRNFEAILERPDLNDQQRDYYQAQLDAYRQGQEVLEGQRAAEVVPPQERELFQQGDTIRQGVEDRFGAPDPRDTSFWAAVAEGAGNMTALAALSLVGPGGTALSAGAGSAMNTSQVYREAIDAGADEETAMRAAKFAAGIGATEVIPITRALKALPPRLRPQITSGVLRRFVDTAQGAGEEAAQEYLAQVANNLVAQNLYDADRGWNEGAAESALVGAVLGGGMGLAGSYMSPDGQPTATRPPSIRGTDEQPDQPPTPRAGTPVTPPSTPSAPNLPPAPTRLDQPETRRAPTLPEMPENLKPGDAESPVPNDILSAGRNVMDAIARGEPIPMPSQPLPDALPQGLGEAAGPALQTTVAQPAAPEAEAVPAPSAQPAPQRQAAPDLPASPLAADVPPAIDTTSNVSEREARENVTEWMPEVDVDADGVETETGRLIRVNLDTGEPEIFGQEATSETPQNAEPSPPVPVDAPEIEATTGEVPDGVEATESVSRPVAGLEILANEDLTSIEAEPDTFQYKSGGDAEGVTDRLLGVKRWETPRAGQAIVFEYNDGRRVIADGHQRIGLAKRLRAEGQDVAMPVTIRREAEGYTPEDVMVEAALKNIAESSATNPDDGAVIDAAKVLRSDPSAIERMNLPQGEKSALGRNARTLTALSPDAFGMVVNERASMRSALAVAKAVPDQAAQANILNVVEKSGARNAFEAEQVARQAAADTVVQTQDSLFGSEEVTETLYLERARVMDQAIKRLRKEAGAFKIVLNNSGMLESVGRNRVDRDASSQKAAEDAAAQEYITRLANSKGPISEALTEAARSVKSGGDLGQAVTGFVKAVRAGLSGRAGTGEAVAQDGAANEQAGGATESAGQDGLPGLTGAATPELNRAEAEKVSDDWWDSLTDDQQVLIAGKLGPKELAAVQHGLKKDSRRKWTWDQSTPEGKRAIYLTFKDANLDIWSDANSQPLPITDQTEAGTQNVIPGAEQSTERSEKARDADRKREVEVRARQSKMRTGVPQGGPGGLFDTQGDMFGQAQATEANQYEPLSRTERRLFNALRDEWTARENLPDTEEGNAAFVAATERVSAARKAFADEYGQNKVNAALERIEAEYQPQDVAASGRNENNKPDDTKPRERIEDFGEKIGGARKDTATPTGPRPTRKKDERPASQRRYEVTQIAADAFNKDRVGKWTISDTRSKSGRIPGFGRGKLDFDTREEAEAALPMVAVSRNHSVMPDGDGFKIVRKVSDRKRPTVKDGFKTREEAMAYMAANATEIAETKLRIDDSIHPALEEALRVGDQRRENDRDVTSRDFVEVFGFRGVEFGNWNNTAERQHLLNQAFDAFLDLAEITRVPPRALSLHGELGLAFGARGQGLQGARAHYERNYGVINLTKIKGAGSLAHEWWHAVDHYFARMDGSAKPRDLNAKEGEPIYDAKTPREDYASHGFLYKSGLREEVRADIKNLMATIMKRKAQYTEDQSSRERVSKRQIERVNSLLDGLEKELSTEQRYGRKKAPATKEQMQRFKQAALKIKAGKDLGEMVDAPTKAQFATYRFYEPVMEIAEVYKEVRGRQAYGQRQGRKYGAAVDLQNAIETRNQAQQFLDDAKAEKVKEKTVRSEFYSEAWMMDQGSKADYWSTNHELAARSFESYVYDRLKDIDARNDFLAYEKRNDLPEYKLFNVKPYPEGQERTDMNAAWDKLFETIQSKEDGDAVMLYQRPLDMFYSPLLKAVSSAKQKQAPAKDWKAIVAKLPGVKKAELEWLGVDEWLDTQEGQVPREALVSFIRDSQIELVETRLAGEAQEDPHYRLELGDALEMPDDEVEFYLDEARAELEEEADDPADVTDEQVSDRAWQMANDAWEPTEYQATLESYTLGFDDIYGTVDVEGGTFSPDELPEGWDYPEDGFISQDGATDWAETQAARAAAGPDSDGEARFSDYTEGGGDNYREMLLRVPNLHKTGKNQVKLTPEQQRRWDDLSQRIRSLMDAENTNDAAARQAAREERVRLDREREVMAATEIGYGAEPFVQSAHFEQENIVVHARVKDRAGANGEKVLFVEEIQSDLASTWRENQEAPEVTARRRELEAASEAAASERERHRNRFIEWAKANSDADFRNFPERDMRMAVHDIAESVLDNGRIGRINGATATQVAIDSQASEEAMGILGDYWSAQESLEQIERDRIALGTEKSMPEGTPDTPFKEEATYTLMVKRLLREAAENGYDRLSWTPGYMQAERWNNAAQSVVEGVEWGAPDSDSIAAAKEGSGTDLSGYRYVYLQMGDRSGKEELTVNPSGKVDSGPGPLEGKQLSQIVGPSLAKQIMTEREGSVTGQKITFPDSGYAIAYDQQIKKAVDKFAKKYGARVRVDKTLPDFETGLGAVIEYASKLPTDEILSRYDTFVESILARDTTIRTEGQERVRQEGLDRRRSNLKRALDAGEVKYALQGLSDNDLKKLFPEAASELSSPVWSIDITPELREAAMEPMAMFKRPDWRMGASHALHGNLSHLRALLDKMNLKQVDLEIMQAPDPNFQGALRIDRKGGMTVLIGASLDPENTLRHEAIHALRAMDLFTENEWNKLSRDAEGWIKKHDIEARYPDLSRLEQIEEAIAEEYAARSSEKVGPFNKIKRFLEALREFLAGRGFQSVDDVFDMVSEGDIGLREGVAAQPGQFNQRNDLEFDLLAFPGESKTVGPEDTILDSDDLKISEAVYGGPQGERSLRYVAYQDGAPVGVLQFRTKGPRSKKAVIQHVYTVRARRREKIAADLLRRARQDFEIEHSNDLSDYGRLWKAADGVRYQRPALKPAAAAAQAQASNTPHMPNAATYNAAVGRSKSVLRRMGRSGARSADVIDSARVLFQDRMLMLRRAVEATEDHYGFKATAEQNPYNAEERFTGQVGRRLEDLAEKFTYPIGKMIARAGKSLSLTDHLGETRELDAAVSLYLWARHAKERNALVAKRMGQGPNLFNPNPAGEGSGLTDAQADAIMAQVKTHKHRKIFETVGNMTDKLGREMIDWRVEAGLLSQDEARQWKAMFKHYVPLTGFAETDSTEEAVGPQMPGARGRRFNVKGKESRSITGRNSEAFDALSNLIGQSEEAIVRGEKNRFMNSVIEFVEAYPAPTMWEIVKPATKKVYNRATGRIETRLQNPSQQAEPNDIAGKVNGEEVWVRLNDKGLQRALGQVGTSGLPKGLVFMSKFSRYFSSVNTMLSPGFILVNAFRDMWTAQINLSTLPPDIRGKVRKKAGFWSPAYWKAFAGALEGQKKGGGQSQWAQYYREFEESGARVNFWNIEDPQAQRDRLKKIINLESGSTLARALKKGTKLNTDDNPALMAIERLNMAVDNAIRLSVFVEARNQGLSDAEAATLSKNLTVNFNRRGELGAVLNSFYTFANAGIQGTHILAKTLKDSGQARGIFVASVLVGMGLEMLNAEASGEDEDGELSHDKIPNFVSERNLILPTGDTRVTIPLPYGYSVPFYAGQQMMKAMRGVKPTDDAMKDVALSVFNNFSPISGNDAVRTITPTALQPAIDIYTNTDWLGRPIRPYSQYNDYGPRSEKYWNVPQWLPPITSGLNRATGGDAYSSGWWDWSPEHVHHVLQFLGGGAGRFVDRTVDVTTKLATGNAADIEGYQIPIVRSFRYKPSSFLDQNRYFEFREGVESANWEAKQRDGVGVPEAVAREAGLYGALRAAEKQRRAITDQINDVYANPNLTDQEQRDRVRPLMDRRAEVYKRFNRVYVEAMGPQSE